MAELLHSSDDFKVIKGLGSRNTQGSDSIFSDSQDRKSIRDSLLDIAELENQRKSVKRLAELKSEECEIYKLLDRRLASTMSQRGLTSKVSSIKAGVSVADVSRMETMPVISEHRDLSDKDDKEMQEKKLATEATEKQLTEILENKPPTPEKKPPTPESRSVMPERKTTPPTTKPDGKLVSPKVKPGPGEMKLISPEPSESVKTSSESVKTSLEEESSSPPPNLASPKAATPPSPKAATTEKNINLVEKTTAAASKIIPPVQKLMSPEVVERILHSPVNTANYSLRQFVPVLYAGGLWAVYCFSAVRLLGSH